MGLSFEVNNDATFNYGVFTHTAIGRYNAKHLLVFQSPDINVMGYIRSHDLTYELERQFGGL